MRGSAVLLALAAVVGAHAGTVTYTFEAPIFTVGETTSISNAPPNSGDIPGFTATFASGLGGAEYSISGFVPNVLFSAQELFAQTYTGSLTINFSQTVTGISFDYALNSLPGGVMTGATLAGSSNSAATNVGGSFPGGVFSLSSGKGFDSITLSAVDVGSNPTQFAIDNLTLSDAPEPWMLLPVSVALAALAGLRRARSRRASEA